MSENITFRSAFSGFNRADVMQYISELLEAKEQDEQRIRELESQLGENEKRIAELTEKLENSSDCTTCDLAKQNEVKIGAAMLDARRFSDLIVDEANEKSARMYESASADAFAAATKAEELAGRLRTISDEYAAEFDMLAVKMSRLFDALTDFGNSVSESQKEFSDSYDENAAETDPVYDEAAPAAGAPSEWQEPFGEGVFDPDFNFLENEGDYTIKIDIDED